MNFGEDPSLLLDTCVCGDYRMDHENASGRCKMPDDLCHGFEPCFEFRLSKRFKQSRPRE
jgi:hypothetical protein